MEIARRLEAELVAALGWPEWSLRTIEVLSLAVLTVSLVQYTSDYRTSTSTKLSKGNVVKPSTEFRWFQLQYLSVYLILMLADWLQGTNMYTLYSSYGVNVGTLFLTGFLSSAVFGTFLGIYVDQWGRKLGCLIFCILEVSRVRCWAWINYCILTMMKCLSHHFLMWNRLPCYLPTQIVINLIEHIPNMPALMFGRFLGGLSTSLLFSAFESWMVSEHRCDWVSIHDLSYHTILPATVKLSVTFHRTSIFQTHSSS